MALCQFCRAGNAISQKPTETVLSTATYETAQQRKDRLDRNVPGYLSERDINRIINALMDDGFIEKLAAAIGSKLSM